MSGVIEGVAGELVAEQQWQKVFKHTFDVVRDYVGYVLMSVGTIALSVRWLNTLGSGDINCMIIGVTNTNKSLTKLGDLSPYPNGGALGMQSYAQTNHDCIRKVYTLFAEYLPYIMLIQTLTLVIVEKFMFKFPKITQKIERFYSNIVQDSLLGKDPDISEYVIDSKSSKEAISRHRSRNEICGSLKRSDIIYRVYIGKNCLQAVFILCIFLPINIVYAIQEKTETPTQCNIEIPEIIGLINTTGMIHFLCEGEKVGLFLSILWIHIFFISVYGLFSMGSIIWCLYFRSLYNLNKVINKSNVGGYGCEIVSEANGIKQQGKDFLFLFDLLAHCCGNEATLRVLTYSDNQIFDLFKPELEPKLHLKIQENKLKIDWYPAPVEKWLNDSAASRLSHKTNIDSYEVTIFPAESVNNIKTLPAKLNVVQNGYLDRETDCFADTKYREIEYVITIACVVGKSRMKGRTIVTYLVPYGPTKPKAGMTKEASTNQVEVHWYPPNGEFKKYHLHVKKILTRNNSCENTEFRCRSMKLSSKFKTPPDSNDLSGNDSLIESETEQHIENLTAKDTTYTIYGLEPGEKFCVELCTKNGDIPSNRRISDIIFTNPLPPTQYAASNISASSVLLNWVSPEKHSCLKGFEIEVTSVSEQPVHYSLTKASNQHTIKDLTPGMDYDITIKSVCTAEKDKRTESIKLPLSITTQLDIVRNLQLNRATTKSISVKWEPPAGNSNFNYTLNIASYSGNQIWDSVFGEEDIPDNGPELLDNDNFEDEDAHDSHIVDTPLSYKEQKQILRSYKQAYTNIAGDHHQYHFKDLPSPLGSGFPYTIGIVVSTKSPKGNDTESIRCEEIFLTRPHPPTEVVPYRFGIQWKPSLTQQVTKYRIKWNKQTADNTAEEEATVVFNRGDTTLSFQFPRDSDFKSKIEIIYNTKICSIVEFLSLNKNSRSLEASKKLVVNNNNEMELFVEEQSNLVP